MPSCHWDYGYRAEPSPPPIGRHKSKRKKAKAGPDKRRARR